MAWKNIKQSSLASSLLIEHAALQELDDVHQLIDWTRIEALLSDIHNKRKGELAWPPLLMFKALLLQSWYKLSDPALEKQLARDLLFRRFVGLDIALAVPDQSLPREQRECFGHSSFWRFREQLEKNNLLVPLLNEINGQLSQQGLIIRRGAVSIVDASVIEAQRSRPNKDKDGNNTQDAEAGYAVKAGADGKIKSTYGFKAHINADEDGFIKAAAFTAGNVHDSNIFTELLSGDESATYADSAYASKKHSAWLKERNIQNNILHRAYRNKPLTNAQKKFNRLQSGTRSIIERVFGILKLHYAMGKARYLGLARNQTRLMLMCIGYNLKRGKSIQRQSCA